MAKGRRAANLAGLAALGALGYAMYNRDRAAKAGGSGPQIVPAEYYAPNKDAPQISQAQTDAARLSGGDISEGERIAGLMAARPSVAREQAQSARAPAAPSAAAPAAVPAAAAPETAAAPLAYTRTDRPRSISENAEALSRVPMRDSYPRTGRPSSISQSAEALSRVPMRPSGGTPSPAESDMRRGRGANRADAPATKQSKQLTREERIAQIPTSGNRTVSGGERVSGNEFTRNLSNTLNATAGLSAPGFVGNMTQKQYNALAALRRQEEGLSAAEAAAARQTAREAKTLNPMAWMAGPKGMAENFKKGGAVKAKKMSSGGSSSASQRGDGIASRGKTKCKMY